MSVAAAFLSAGFRQQLAYRTANAAGLFTNLMFLSFRTGVMAACFEHQSSISGLDPMSAVSFAAITQACLMVAPQWGTLGLSADIRSGQIAVVLQRPVDPYLAYVSTRLGTSLFMVFGRMIPILGISWLFGVLALPPSPSAAVGFCLSLILSALVAVAIQLIVESASFWLLSDHGMRMLTYGLGVTSSGLLLPLSWYPDTLQMVFRAMPFAETLNTPTEIWLGLASPVALLRQLSWVIALVIVGKGLLTMGLRKLSLHGG